MKDIVIFDLDGTLANTAECRHLIEGKKKQWDEFCHAACEVSEVYAVSRMARILSEHYKIYIVSGRSDMVRNKTKKWLEQYNIPFYKLIMRKHGDHMPDHELKWQWVCQGKIPGRRILCVFDDRTRVVKMWRSHGIPCFQVDEGEF